MGAMMAALDQGAWLRNDDHSNSEDLFLANCMMARAVGFWAADLLGVQGDQAETYAHALVMDFVKPGAFDIVQKLQTDFRAQGLDVSEHRIMAVLEQQRKEAQRRVALRIWSKAPGDGGWERRTHPRVIVPPMVVPPTLEQWLERHRESGGE